MDKMNMKRTKKEIYFVFVMAGCMSLTMSCFNAFWNGGISWISLQKALTGWWFEYVCAVILMMSFVSKLAFKMADALMSRRNSAFKMAFILPTCTVAMMAPLMSFLALTYCYGWTDAFANLYGQALVRNYPFAWISQICVVGPLVKAAFKMYENRKKLLCWQPEDTGSRFS